MASQEVADGLTDIEREILDLERSWWKYAGAKESTVRGRFGISSVRYYQLLNALLDKPAALEHDPMLVRRLQRLRDARRNHRTAAARLS